MPTIITRFRGAAGVFEHDTSTGCATDHHGARETCSLAAFLRGCHIQRQIHLRFRHR